MNHLEHLKGNFIIAGAGIGISYLSKKIFKREFIPVSSGKQIAISFSFLSLITILGKKAMDEMGKLNWVSFDAQGFNKNPNEGFIGPLKNETFGPENWDFLPKN